jgi:hypothetical protein
MGYILLPVGYSYNQDIASAKKGDVLIFFDGGSYTIDCVRRIDSTKPEADLLCRIRYGIPMKAAKMRWRDNLRLEGHGPKAISENECLWVVYQLDEDE